MKDLLSPPHATDVSVPVEVIGHSALPEPQTSAQELERPEPAKFGPTPPSRLDV